jgi:hypothetical protein
VPGGALVVSAVGIWGEGRLVLDLVMGIWGRGRVGGRCERVHAGLLGGEDGGVLVGSWWEVREVLGLRIGEVGC